MNLRPGTATAIGSLPHRHPDAAVSVSVAACPELPAAPSLPRLDPREGMLAQAAWGMRGVRVDESGNLECAGPFDIDDPFEVAFDPVGPSFSGVGAFLSAVRHRTAPIKLQATGPVTLMLALIGAGAAVDEAFAAAAAAVRVRVEEMCLVARRSAPLAPLVFFLDEPGLMALNQPGFPVPTEDALDSISGVLRSLESYAVTGLHSCGDADWRLALATGPQILSLPLSRELTDHAGALGVHLDRGGWIAWGVVPTGRPVGDQADPLWRTMSDVLCELVQRGCDGLRLREQALITPECGMALHDPVQAERLLALNADIAQRVRRQSFGVRLSVGA